MFERVVLKRRVLADVQRLHDHADDAGAPGVAWLLFAGLGSAIAALVVVGALAGRLGVPIGWPLLAVAAAAGCALALPALRQVQRLRWPVLLCTLVAFVSLTLAGLAQADPSLLPPGGSVDAVLHYLLIRWIDTHAALPQPDEATLRLLGEMAAHPPGFALLVLAAAPPLGRAPLFAMFPVVAALGGMIAALVLLLSIGASRPRALFVPLGLTSTLLLASHRTYTLNAYLDQSYYAMVLGVVLVLLACAWVALPAQFAVAHALQSGLVITALLAVYPVWAPIPLGMAALGVLLRATGWRRRVLLGIAALLPPLLFALIDLLPRLGVGLAILAHQGVAPAPALHEVLPLALALPAIPLALRQRHARWLVLAAGLALCEMLALHLAIGPGLATPYHRDKVLFVLVPLACAIVAAGLLALAMIERRGARLAGLAVALALLLATGSFQVIPPPAHQPIDADMVAAARWLVEHHPDSAATAIAVSAPPGVQPYWLQVGLFGQPRDAARTALLSAAPPTAEGWALNDQLPDRAIALYAEEPPPGAMIAARFGQVAVLQRTGLPDPQVSNPLLVRYRAFWEEARVKTAIELLQPLPEPLPLLELRLYHNDRLVNRFPLQPTPGRTRMQYLGGDLLPDTLGGVGYVNRDAYPTFPPPSEAPAGPMSLVLHLLVDGASVDQRLLATFHRGADATIAGLATHSGELVYVRREVAAADLRPAPAAFTGPLALDGWRAPGRAAPGDELEVLLRWSTSAPVGQSFLTGVRLLDAGGAAVAEHLAAPQGGFYPTWRWRAGEQVVERRRLSLPADLLPGGYRLVALLHDPRNRAERSVVLGEVRVVTDPVP